MVLTQEEKDLRKQRRLAREQWKWTVAVEKITKKRKKTDVIVEQVTWKNQEFWFDLPLWEYLSNYVNEFIRRSWYVALEYQKKIINDNVTSFLYTYLFEACTNLFCEDSVNSKPEKIQKWIEKSFWIAPLEQKDNFFKESFLTWVAKKDFLKKQKWFLNILHIDVWLWKTLMSVVSMLTIIKWIFYLDHVVWKMNFKKDWFFDDDFRIQDLEKKLKNREWIVEKDLKINIICKKILSLEFQEVLKRINPEIWIEFLYNWISKDWYDFDNDHKVAKLLTYISHKASFLYYDEVFDPDNDEHINETFSSFMIINKDYMISAEPDKELQLENSIWLFIIDEFWTDKFLFWSWKSEEKRNRLWKIYWVWLTASVVPKLPLDQVVSQFVKKKDVLWELTWKWLYKEDWFLYKNINEINTEYEDILEWLRKVISEYKAKSNLNIASWRKIIDLMKESIEEFVKSNHSDVEEFIWNIMNLKKAFDSQTWWKWWTMRDYEKAKLEWMIAQFETLKKEKIKSFYKKDILSILSKNDLNYLFEKNTIIIFDKFFDHDKIKDFREKLEKEWIKFVTVENSKELKWTWNVLIWDLNSLSKWINLQNFDNLLFLYLNQMTFDDVHQTIWRIDRIWSVTNKEIVFLSFVKDTWLIDKIIKKRKEISNKYNIENYLLQDWTRIEWLNEYQDKITWIKTEFAKLFEKKEITWVDKEKMKLLKENETMIKEMIKDMYEQCKTYEEANSVIYWASTKEDLELVQNIIWLAS